MTAVGSNSVSTTARSMTLGKGLHLHGPHLDCTRGMLGTVPGAKCERASALQASMSLLEGVSSISTAQMRGVKHTRVQRGQLERVGGWWGPQGSLSTWHSGMCWWGWWGVGRRLRRPPSKWPGKDVRVYIAGAAASITWGDASLSLYLLPRGSEVPFTLALCPGAWRWPVGLFPGARSELPGKKLPTPAY